MSAKCPTCDQAMPEGIEAPLVFKDPKRLVRYVQKLPPPPCDSCGRELGRARIERDVMRGTDVHLFDCCKTTTVCTEVSK